MSEIKEILKLVRDIDIRLKKIEKKFSDNTQHNLQLTSKNITQKTSKKGPKYHLEELKTEGFFEKPQNMKNILDELKGRTYYYKAQDLTLPLRNLVREKILRRVEQKNDKDKILLHWVNW